MTPVYLVRIFCTLLTISANIFAVNRKNMPSKLTLPKVIYSQKQRFYLVVSQNSSIFANNIIFTLFFILVMEKVKYLIIVVFFCIPLSIMAQGSVEVNKTNFPDENFRSYINSNYGDVLTEEKIKEITQIDVVNINISSLKGIEYFTALTSLWCHANQITELDVSKNTVLTELICQNNHLTTLNVSGCAALTKLDCGYNQIETLDVSNNTVLSILECNANLLTAIDISSNTELTELNCAGNQITNLDVSNNVALTALFCSNNPLTALNVSNNIQLTNLSCVNNQLATLDVSNNTKLTNLNCADNQLTTLDLSNNSEIVYIYCNDNKITDLDLSNCTGLTWAYCYSNQIININLPKTKTLTDLSCFNNQLETLDVSNNTELTVLYCNNNKLKRLNFSNNPALRTLFCYCNQIGEAEMDELIGSLPQVNNSQFCIYNNTGAEEGNICTKAQVAAAKAKGWTPLYWTDNGLWAEYEGYDNDYPSGIIIDQNNFPDDNFRNYLLGQSYGKDEILTREEIKEITSINICSSNIKSLKGIEYLTALNSLDCSDNQLTTLDISGCVALTEIICYRNQIKGAAMDALIDDLPQADGGNLYVYDNTKQNEGNICTKMQVATAKDKGWTMYYANNGRWEEYEGSDDEDGVPAEIAINETNFPDEYFRNYLLEQSYGEDGILTQKEIRGITEINVANRHINSLTGIEYFTALKTLWCYHLNQLTTLDVSKNTALTDLNCADNQLKTLNISNNAELETLGCNNNQLTALDVSKNKKLTHIGCSNNLLTTLDISNNTELTWLQCFNNQLTTLNTSNNTRLTALECSSNNLEMLDISNNTELTRLSCGGNPLMTLDVSRNTKLSSIDCMSNQLTTLDVSNNTALTSLSCSWNQLTTLDVSNNMELISLDCSENQLIALDVSNNTRLKQIECFSNQIKEAPMEVFVNSLPQTDNGDLFVYDNSWFEEGNVWTETQIAAAKTKGWTSYYFNGWWWVAYETSDDDPAGITKPATEAIETNVPVYTLSGQKVNGNNLKGKKGIYIIDGKKVVIK